MVSVILGRSNWVRFNIMQSCETPEVTSSELMTLPSQVEQVFRDLDIDQAAWVCTRFAKHNMFSGLLATLTHNLDTELASCELISEGLLGYMSFLQFITVMMDLRITPVAKLNHTPRR